MIITRRGQLRRAQNSAYRQPPIEGALREEGAFAIRIWRWEKGVPEMAAEKYDSLPGLTPRLPHTNSRARKMNHAITATKRRLARICAMPVRVVVRTPARSGGVRF